MARVPLKAILKECRRRNIRFDTVEDRVRENKIERAKEAKLIAQKIATDFENVWKKHEGNLSTIFRLSNSSDMYISRAVLEAKDKIKSIVRQLKGWPNWYQDYLDERWEKIK